MPDQKQRGTPVAVTPKETKDAHKIPKPAPPEFENQLLNLFQKFLCNTNGVPSIYGTMCRATP